MPLRLAPVVRLGLIGLLLVAGLGGCGWFDDDPGDRVLVVGDSVTVLSREQLGEELDWADDLDIRATKGLRSDELLPGARAGVEAGPSSAVWLPGYNDVLQDRVEQAPIDEMMDLADEVPCSVWLTLPTDGVYPAAVAQRWNERVRAAAEGRDDLHVVDDWERLVENSPEFTFTIEADALHPNADGQAALARVMSDSLRELCG